MESNVSVSSVTDVRSYRWSSADEADRFSVENPATGEVIAEHSIETLSHFGYRKLIRIPSGIGTRPSWRAVTKIFD
jgi:hypothetical protein